jgi:predicted DNA-binding protein
MDKEKMIRKQIYLESSQNLKIKMTSSRKGTTEAQIIREAIEEYLIADSSQTEDPLRQLIGVAKTAEKDGSIMHDRDLYTTPRNDE